MDAGSSSLTDSGVTDDDWGISGCGSMAGVVTAGNLETSAVLVS